MGYKLRAIAHGVRFPDEVRLNALERAIPQAMVEAVITDLGAEEQRTRKLPAEVTLWLSVAMGLFTNMALEQVLIKMVKGLLTIPIGLDMVSYIASSPHLPRPPTLQFSPVTREKPAGDALRRWVPPVLVFRFARYISPPAKFHHPACACTQVNTCS
jgi:hypothetical protein